MAEVDPVRATSDMRDAGESGGRVLHVMSRVNGVLDELASMHRRQSTVTRVLRECHVRGNKDVSNFEAYVEIHAESGSYVCLWFDLGFHAIAGWTVGASVLRADAIGAPQDVLARFPDTACANFTEVESAAVVAVEWLSRESARGEHFKARL